MRVEGKVISVEGQTALVATAREASCEACEGGDACGCDDLFFVTAMNPIGAERGERVEMELGAGRMWLTVLIVFWLPLFLGGAGYALPAAFLPDAAWAAVAGAVVGVALAVAVIVGMERRAGRAARQYRICRRL